MPDPSLGNRPDPIVADLLGPVRLAVGPRAIPDGAWSRRSSRELLLLLLATPGHRLPRDRVLDLLWPDAAPAAGRNALYKALHALRRVLEPGLAAGSASAYVQVGTDAIALHPAAPLLLDVDAFEERLAAAAALAADARRPPLRDALARYRGDLLAAEPALDWTIARREGLRRRWHRAALDLAELEMAAGAPAAALPPLDAILAADATDEAALRLLMRALAKLGRRDEALRRYEQGRTALRDELGVEPDMATSDLAASLRLSAAAQARPAPLPTPPPPRRWEEVPAPPSPLVGRARELERTQDLLWQPEVRLVTLTGPGGVGKTRLALEVATAMLGELEQGACFVDLAPLRDPGLVLPVVARTLGLDEELGQTALATLRHALRAAELLLVLDNCEQVLAASPAIAELLAGCRRLKVLATSREPLRLRAEHELPVPPLGLPPTGRTRGPARPADLARYEAPALFLQRARAVAPDAALGEAEAAAIVDICTRLDGLPLAIELAAARSRELPPSALLARLGRRLPELGAGYRDLPARQQTLRDAIAWSHDLLTAEEQLLFRRLAVFAGHFSRRAVEAVCDVPGAWEKLRSLADKGLVRWDQDRAAEDEAAGGRMLETIREFAQERLAASGEEAAVQRAHVGYALSFADEAWPHLSGPSQGEWFDRLEADLDNLREALAWALVDDPGRALLLARLLGTLWKRRGYFREALGWHDRILAASGHLATADRAWVLCDAGWMAEMLGDLDRAESCHVASLALARMLPDDRSIWRALNHLGMVAQSRGEIERALALREETLAAARATGDERAIDSSLANLGGVLLAAGDIDGAASRLEESLAINRTLGDPVRLAEVQNYVGLAAAWRGDFDGALAHYEESLAAFRAAGDGSGVALVLSNLGEVYIHLGQVERGAEVLRESLARHRDLGDRRNAAVALMNLAEAAVRQGEAAAPLLAEALSLLAGIGDQALAADVLEQVARLVVERGKAGAEAALRLAGGAEAVWRATGASRQPPNAPLHAAAMATARAALDPQTAALAWKTGLAAGFDEAIADALAALAADHGRLAASLT